MILAASVLPPMAPAARAQHELHFSNDFSVVHHDVTGPGTSQSVLRQGFSDLDLLNIYGNGKVKGYSYDFNVGSKLTNDPNNDVRDFSITNLHAKVADQVQTLTAGDVFEGFSQYALGTAVKGASYKYSNPSRRRMPEVTALYGYAYPRWDNIKWFFAGRAGQLTTINRAVFGSRVKQNLSDNLWAGLSYVSSVDRTRINPTDENYNNKAYTGDWEYTPIPGATLSGEHSFSSQKDSPSETLPNLLRHGYAHRLTVVGDADPSRISLEYEKISPYFTTLMGAATPDREKVKSTWRYKVFRDLTVHTGFLWFHDDLEGQIASGRADSYKPDIGVSLKRLFGRQYAAADVTYRYNTTARHTNAYREDHVVAMNYRDRFLRLDSDTNFSCMSNRTGTSSRTRDYTYNTSLSSRHTVRGVILKPSVYLGGWTNRDELSYSSDQFYEYSGGLGVDLPALKVTSDVKVGENQLQKTNGDGAYKIFANASVYYRPTLLEKLQGMIYLRLLMNDFSYPGPNRNFRETSVSSGLSVQL